MIEKQEKTILVIVVAVVVVVAVFGVAFWYSLPHEHRWHGTDGSVHCNHDVDRQTCIGEHHSYTCVTTYGDGAIDHWCTEGIVR